MPTHLSIKPIKCQINKSFLYNLEEHDGEWVKARIIGLTSYVGDSLTLHVVVEETGAIFSYMPLHSVRHKDEPLFPQFSYKELDYEFCHDPNMVMVEFEHLANSNMMAAIKDGESLIRFSAEYICTLDWPDDNYLQHFVKLSNGQFAAVPNHKILVGSADSEFPKYKKLRHRWD